MNSRGLASVKPRLRWHEPRDGQIPAILSCTNSRTVLWLSVPRREPKESPRSRAFPADSPLPVSSPVWGGQVLLLLELLLQAHELQLGEDGAAPAGLLLPGRGLLRLRLAAAVVLARSLGRGGLGGRVVGQSLGDSRGGGDQVRDDCGLSGDHREERICPKGSGAWKTSREGGRTGAVGEGGQRPSEDPGPRPICLAGPPVHRDV